jgi:uncharacterized Tic20 family protein
LSSANSTDFGFSGKFSDIVKGKQIHWRKMSDFTPPPPPPAGFNSEMPERSQDDAVFAILGHLGSWIVGFFAPLLIFVLKGKESRFLRHHSIEALNFQISITIYAIASGILMLLLIGFLLIFVVGAIAIILPILATVAANKGEYYRYPLTIRLIKA